jgi:hypothetical protein
LDKFGYVPILKEYLTLFEQLEDKTIDVEQAVDSILEIVKSNFEEN